ncbi:MAG: ABC transporter ATP-binding protein [Hyphomicrobiaceae bacterium]|nr:ABC transporter ATP-binding protein [Hyphomicrobiaceae bacterium]
MPGQPGSPLITQEWQIALVLVAGVIVVAILNRIIRRKVRRDNPERRDD